MRYQFLNTGVRLHMTTQSLVSYVVRHYIKMGRGVGPRGGRMALGGGLLLTERLCQPNSLLSPL